MSKKQEDHRSLAGDWFTIEPNESYEQYYKKQEIPEKKTGFQIHAVYKPTHQKFVKTFHGKEEKMVTKVRRIELPGSSWHTPKYREEEFQAKETIYDCRTTKIPEDVEDTSIDILFRPDINIEFYTLLGKFVDLDVNKYIKIYTIEWDYTCGTRIKQLWKDSEKEFSTYKGYGFTIKFFSTTEMTIKALSGR